VLNQLTYSNKRDLTNIRLREAIEQLERLEL
jgi:hypothetical protein